MRSRNFELIGFGIALNLFVLIVETRAADGPSDKQAGGTKIEEAPPPFTSPANVYSGVSGAGAPVTGEGRGGWRSGAEGVIYRGPNPKAGWNTDWGNRSSGSAIQAGLIPSIKPIWDLHLRDTIIRLSPDGFYYMTGSSGDNIWDRNDGIELWRSKDLQNWDYLGLVWSVERDSTWENQWRKLHDKPTRNIWAPEIHFIKGNVYLAFCMAPGGCQILKSKTGKPEGPYVSTLKPDRPIAGGIDATLFEDDDGKVYFSNGGGGRISLMKDDMSGIAEAHPVQLSVQTIRPGRATTSAKRAFRSSNATESITSPEPAFTKVDTAAWRPFQTISMARIKIGMKLFHVVEEQTIFRINQEIGSAHILATTINRHFGKSRVF